MSHDAGEVSWQTLRRIVHKWSGAKAELEQVTALDGGSIGTTLQLSTKAGEKAVLKVSPHRVDRSYLTEAHQLNLLRQVGLPTPRVWDCHMGSLDSPDSYLLIEHIPGINLAAARKQAPADQMNRLQQQLAEYVIAMHGKTAGEYSRVEPGGSEGFTTWPAFYRSLYDTIWHECERHARLPPRVRRTMAKLHEKLDQLLTHDDKPRLTHGDLWCSNVMADVDLAGQWRITGILDPHCRYGHAECELAYLDLFRTSTPAFLKAYQRAFPLPDEYERVRKPVYQAYELINHVNLFGEKYIKPLQETLEKLN